MTETQNNHLIPLPDETRKLVGRTEQSGKAHPGLWLDRFVPSWDIRGRRDGFSERVQTPAVNQIVSLSQRAPDGLEFDQLRQRHTKTLDTLGAAPFRFQATTAGPLTLHLARASALENAGLCLHPVYGFAYLPGSGLKGMAHAFACEVWLPAQPDPDAAWDHICRVFGTAPSPWLKKLARRLKVTAPETARAGEIVFHDAWPVEWPKLVADIVNCHHGDYYGAGRSDDTHPPGDWESPVPVNFLAIAPGTTFDFAVTPRCSPQASLTDPASPADPPDPSDPADPASPNDPAALARQWLAGALLHLGAGAKTAAGYGSFTLDEATDESLTTAVRQTWQAIQDAGQRQEFRTTLELVTPAFFSGPDHADPAGCDLRPATLRGLLRWWWRTLHADHVDTATLRRMEAAVWGDTDSGAAVRITLEPAPDSPRFHVTSFDKRSYESVNRHEKTGPYGIPVPEDLNSDKVTPGIAYLAFGMDDMVKQDDGSKHRRQRSCVRPGCRWALRLTARPVKIFGTESDNGKKATKATGELSADLILEQAKAAVWLLLTYGGAGSKSRNGFGSLAAPDFTGYSLPMCQAAAAQFRREFGAATPGKGQHDPTSALDTCAGEDVVVDFTNWPDAWTVLEQVGFAVQAFAKGLAHDESKRALGLPRKTKPPTRGRFQPTGAFKEVYDKADKHGRPPRPWEKARFASPWHIHLDRLDDGFRVRITAFVQSTLPDAARSRELLAEFLKFVQLDLARRAELEAPRPPAGSRQSKPAPSSPSLSTPEVTREDVAAKVAELAQQTAGTPQTEVRLLFKVEKPSENSQYQGQFLNHAPKIAAGYQTQGNKRLTDAPDGLAADILVIAERQSATQARFQEVFGRLPPSPPKNKKGNPRGRRR